MAARDFLTHYRLPPPLVAEEQYQVYWNDTVFRFFSISQQPPSSAVGSTACRIQILPASVTVNIPSNLSVPVVLPRTAETYNQTSFSPATIRWIQTALNFTKNFIAEVDAEKQPVMPDFNINHCELPPFVSYVMNDSCVGSEIGRVFLGYLKVLLSVPPVPVTVERYISDPEGNPWEPPFGQYTTAWQWGPVETKYVPNKAICAALIAMVVLPFFCLYVLHALSAPLGFGVSLGVRDIAPWAGIADIATPPKPLEGLGDVGIDEMINQEKLRGVVLSLVPASDTGDYVVPQGGGVYGVARRVGAKKSSSKKVEVRVGCDWETDDGAASATASPPPAMSATPTAAAGGRGMAAAAPQGAGGGAAVGDTTGGIVWYTAPAAGDAKGEGNV